MESTFRYLATEHLRETLVQQGRKASWLCLNLGVSKTLMSLVLSRQRSLGHQEAEQVSTLLGVPFSVLFELADASHSVSVTERVA
jgi:antitoxin component HigA of HigAB toxin-antitoxin module